MSINYFNKGSSEEKEPFDRLRTGREPDVASVF